MFVNVGNICVRLESGKVDTCVCTYIVCVCKFGVWKSGHLCMTYIVCVCMYVHICTLICFNNINTIFGLSLFCIQEHDAHGLVYMYNCQSDKLGPPDN